MSTREACPVPPWSGPGGTNTQMGSSRARTESINHSLESVPIPETNRLHLLPYEKIVCKNIIILSVFGFACAREKEKGEETAYLLIYLLAYFFILFSGC